MSSDKQIWLDFIGWCERLLDEHRKNLRPLEDGRVHTGKKGADTGGIWKDTTQDEIVHIKRKIVELEALIAEHKHKVK